MFEKMKEELREALTGSAPDNDLRARLHADHAEVSRLIDELLATDDVDVSSRDDLKVQIIIQLTAHAKAEEEVVYTYLRQDEQLRAAVDDGVREHQEIDDALRDLETLDAGDQALEVVLRELKSSVDHHVQEEESEVLPRAERVFGQQALVALIPTFNQRRMEIMDNLIDQMSATEPGYRRAPNRLSESDSRF